MKNRIVFRIGDVLHVVRLGNTTNKKIMSSAKEKMVQTYHFSSGQFDEALKPKADLKAFFEELSDSNCLDCPLREYGKCYTHKFTQARGFLSMLRSISKEFNTFADIPMFTAEMYRDLVEMSSDRFVRFGTYGEPSLLPITLVESMVDASRVHTGYTHQWRLPFNDDFKRFFMASTQGDAETLTAERKGWRVFQAVDQLSPLLSSVNCPASKEGGFKSSCDRCGLCSGTEGKGRVSIHIVEH